MCMCSCTWEISRADLLSFVAAFFADVLRRFAEICGDSDLCLKSVHKFAEFCRDLRSFAEKFETSQNPQNTKCVFKFPAREISYPCILVRGFVPPFQIGNFMRRLFRIIILGIFGLVDFLQIFTNLRKTLQNLCIELISIIGPQNFREKRGKQLKQSSREVSQPARRIRPIR